MTTPATKSRRVRWPVILAVICASLGTESLRASDQNHVLVLYSTRRDAQASIVGDRELPRILGAGVQGPLDYHSEYIDLARLADPGYLAAFAEFLTAKYKGLRFDVVIAVQDAAVEFFRNHREQLFPDVPLVFVSTVAPPAPISNSTGLLVELDLAGTVELANELQPTLEEVVVVSGADARDRNYERLARAQLRALESRFQITFLAGLSASSLEDRLANLPDDSAVIYLVVNRDGSGVSHHPLEYLARIVSVSRAPVYSWIDSAMGRGIVGGSLRDLDRQMDALGQLVLRVLNGERAGDIPVSAPRLATRQVDWRQLERWGIDHRRIAPGTVVLFREPSAWDRYKIYIVGASALLAGESLLIAGLLIQKRRRQLAEEAARGSQLELRSRNARIRDLGRRLLSAQDAERAHIARELHDDISQQLALLEIDLELLTGTADGDLEELGAQALQRTHGISQSIHELSHSLHPARLRLVGLVSALEGLQRELARSGTSVVLRHENVPADLPADLTLSLFRVVQEALQNAVKHGRAREVVVDLRGGLHSLTLTVTDDGIGFEPASAWSKGLGLVSISERLESMGGACRILSSPGAGTRLEATVPTVGTAAPPLEGSGTA